MDKRITFLVVLSMTVLFSGCSQKLATVKALQQADVGEMASKKKVAVNLFQGDTLGLSSKIEAQIANQRLDDERYFQVLSRKDLDKVLNEQKLQSSELIDEKSAARIGKLIGAQALITGEVKSSAKEDTYQDRREKCVSRYSDSNKCAKTKVYHVTCRTTNASVDATINIIDMESGSIIFADTLSGNYTGDSCKDGYKDYGFVAIGRDNATILTKEKALQNITNNIAYTFAKMLTPKYIYFNVALLDDVEFEITEKQEKLLETSLKYIEAGRIKKAEKIVNKLNKSLNSKSYVVLYNMGVIKEATGKLEEAQKIYALADELTIEPIQEINHAVLRIALLIKKQKKAVEQINR